MFLAVDSGNTRVKWALCDASGAIVESGALPVERGGWIAGLRRVAARATTCRAAHVGGAARGEKLRTILEERTDFEFVRAEKRARGVTNHYRPPESLGADRWLALIATRALREEGGGGNGKKAGKRANGSGWVIVSAGTATTIDGLTADGDFLGGVILPGLASFPAALAGSTAIPRAALTGGRADGEREGLRHPPRTTADAAEYGALCATAGAAREYRRRFLRGAECIVTGGEAARLSALLPDARVIPALVLRGLITRHAGE